MYPVLRSASFTMSDSASTANAASVSPKLARARAYIRFSQSEFFHVVPKLTPTPKMPFDPVPPADVDPMQVSGAEVSATPATLGALAGVTMACENLTDCEPEAEAPAADDEEEVFVLVTELLELAFPPPPP